MRRFKLGNMRTCLFLQFRVRNFRVFKYFIVNLSYKIINIDFIAVTKLARSLRRDPSVVHLYFITAKDIKKSFKRISLMLHFITAKDIKKSHFFCFRKNSINVAQMLHAKKIVARIILRRKRINV